MTDKPIPLVDLDQQPYWEAARKGELSIQKCKNCGEYVHPPGPGCPWCGSKSLTWEQIGTEVTGTIYSFIVVYRAVLQSFVNDVPYAVALCDVDKVPGIRITANVVNCDYRSVHIGMPVKMVWESRSSDWSIPQWEPRAIDNKVNRLQALDSGM